MTRRDTIILAVLINATLLSVLFFTATRPDVEVPSGPIAIQRTTPLHQSHPYPASGFAASRTESESKRDPLVSPFASSQDEPVHIAAPQRLFDDHMPSSTVVSADEESSPPERPAAPVHESEYVEVLVKRGDFLEKIARSSGTTVSEVKRINHLTSDRIDIGQVLLVPATRRPTLTRAQPVTILQPEDTDVEYYIMKPGDNPWNIARQNHVNFEELLRLNNLNEERARNLKPGDKIRVR